MIKEQIKDGYMNGQDKEKHMTHRIKEHITCGRKRTISKDNTK